MTISKIRAKLQGFLRQCRFFVVQIFNIFNLPYRRFSIGKTLLAGGELQLENLRYSRLQVCATRAAA